MRKEKNPNPEQDPDEELKNLPNDLGEDSDENPEESLGEEYGEYDSDIFEDIDPEEVMSMDIPDHVYRFCCEIPDSSKLTFNEKECHAVNRAFACRVGTDEAKRTEDSGYVGDTLCLRMQELTMLLKDTLDIRERAELMGADTTRDMGLFLASLTEEIGCLGSMLAKISSAVINKSKK